LENLIKQGFDKLTAFRKKFLDSLSLGDLETELVEKAKGAGLMIEHFADDVVRTMENVKEEAEKRTKELFGI